MLFTGAGPGRLPRRRGRQHTNLSGFPKNCMKLRKFWFVGGGGGAGGAPLNPPLVNNIVNTGHLCAV